MWPASLNLPRADLPLVAVGAGLTVTVALASTRIGGTFSLGVLVAITFFFFAVAGFIAFPHITVAAMIPTFALIPAIKVLAVPWIGPAKDALTLAAITAAAVLVVQRSGEGHRQPGDFWVGAMVLFVIGLYFVNLGGRLEHDVAWAQGIRLISEPLLLLVVGFLLPQPRRVLRWAIVSLVATGVFVALVGIAQQALGEARLIELGYSYTIQVRSIGDRLRSFGTMDESFAYAAFLLLALVALMIGVRRGIPAVLAGFVIALGLLFSYVRTALVILIALLGLWLWRSQRPTIAAFLLSVAVMAAAVILVWSSGGTETRTVRAGPSLFLTINGRTEGWKVVLDSPRTWAVGKGVGEVGVAAERATYSVSRRERDQSDVSAVDSGYFALIADVGFIGLVAFLALAGRLFVLAKHAIDRGIAEGWLAAGFLLVILLDAVTRDSFTGFPTAFLGLLLVGLSLAAARETEEAAEETTSPGRPAVARPARA
jgi:O-Antigen ligase